MPISNYQTPGVYVTQLPTPIISSPVATNSLNICILGNASGILPNNSQTDTFLWTSTSGVQTFILSQGSNYIAASGITITSNLYGTVISGATTVASVTSGILTLSGSGFPNGGTNPTYYNAAYNYTTVTTGQLYTFSSYSALQSTFGAPFSYVNGQPAVTSPCSLAGYLAFANGAQQITVSNITYSGTTAGIGDWTNNIQALAGVQGIDVIVPLVYDPTFNFFITLSTFLNAQSTNNIYQRAFVGMDSSVGNYTVTSGIALAQSLVSTTGAARMTVAAPNQITYNPGFNTATGSTTGTVNIAGYYLSAALAGLFAGQPDVYVPITNKTVNGITGIPNQITQSQSTTLQSYGVTVARQQNNGNIVVRQGLTTNTNNWLTQELSIQAIGDRLANLFLNNLGNGSLIGSPLTATTLSSVQGLSQSILNQASGSGLIQSYTNLIVEQSPSNPTQINVSFQYSPTLPLNYINVVFGINTASGAFTVA